MKNLDCINKLINCFTRLPGVGYKTAERYAYKIVESDQQTVDEFCAALSAVKRDVVFCATCGNFATAEVCGICDRRANAGVICVVKDPRDVIAIEKSGAFDGLYHVLHGVISPLDKKGPNDINLKNLLSRLKNENIREIIVATNPDIEGEATAMYIAGLIKPLGVRVTRLAQGLALGSYLEYADRVTLSAAISNRVTL